MKAIGKKTDPVGQAISNTFGGSSGKLDPLHLYETGEEQNAARDAATAATFAAGQTSAIVGLQESEANVERRRLLAQQQARSRAARRGGYRALLSQQRLTPETGLQTTLGPA